MAQKKVTAAKTVAAAKTVLLTLQETSSETGIPYSSVRLLCAEGHLPMVRLGSSRRIWVRRADVERLIEQSTAR